MTNEREVLKPPSRLGLIASIFGGFFLILIVDTAFFTLLVLVLILIVGAQGYHISVYK